MTLTIAFTPIVWFAIFILLLVVEFLTVGLVTIWFALGALVAMVIDLAGGGFWPQMIGFLVVSLAALLITRPLAVKHINQNHEKTNIEELEGQIAIVVEEINNLKGTGRILLRGMDWRAVTEDPDEILPVNTKVQILAVSGVKVIVKKKEDQ